MNERRRSIYVETRIRGSLDDLWRRTQCPELHERWDLRFTSITYLKRRDDAAPQRFRYATRVGFGVEIEGWGETVGERLGDGERVSALRFGADDPRSLIRSGSGYWRYEQIEDGVRFLTAYDYEVRGGAIGRVVDRILFRPVLGWATAWSFDRLRLWIEAGMEPGRTARRAVIHGLSATVIAFVWMWEGIVPKLAGPHPDEIAMLLATGVPEAWTNPLAYVAGAVEVAFGLAFVPCAGRRWPWLLTILAMAGSATGVVLTSSHLAAAPFNPVTLNVSVAALAMVGLLALPDLPSARRCLRRAPRKSGSKADS